MTATHQSGTRHGPLEGRSEQIGQPRIGARVGTLPSEPAGLSGYPGYADPFGPVPSPATTTATVHGAPAPRTAPRRKAVHKSMRRQRFWGVAILVLFVLGVTAAKWFAQ